MSDDDTQLALAAPPGLTHLHIIDTEGQARMRLHALLSRRPNSVVRAYRKMDLFLGEAADLDGGCILLVVREHSSETFAFLRSLKREARFRCVVLTTQADLNPGIEAMKAGAVDYLLLDTALNQPEERLLPAIDEALGQVRQARAMSAALERARARIERLTVREREVLIGLVAGKSNKMIAQELAISPRTIEIYRAHLMEKLGSHSLSETLRIAFAAGIA